MANLFDYLTNTVNKVKNSGNALYDKLAQNTPQLNKDGEEMEYYERLAAKGKIPMQNTSKNPQVEAIQLDGNGDVDAFSSLEMGQRQNARTPMQHLFGRNMTMDKQTFNPETNQYEIETISNFKPGFFNDIASGAQENYNTAFDVNNLAPKGRGLGYKIGEGLGSFARGLAGWGGDAWIAGKQGLDEAVKRQNLRSADAVYRKLLNEEGVDTSDVNGMINDQTFRNYSLYNYRNRSLDVRTQLAQMKDNTSRAKMIMSGLNNGTLSPDEAVQHMQDYGITFDDLQVSNQTRNTNVNEAIAPAKINALNSGASAAVTNAANNTARTEAYVNYMKNKPARPEANPNYNNDLANYVTIMTDPKYAQKRNEARTRFIQTYGIDPMKKAEVW